MRLSVAALVFVLATTLQAGCAAIHHDLGLPEEGSSAHESEQQIRSVAVRPPVLRYEDPVQEGLVDEVEESAHLIRTLRKTGLFERVDYTDALRCPIDIELAAVRGASPRDTTAPLWLHLATLSIAIIDSREGVSFYPIDAPQDRVDLAYRTRLYVGIGPLLASPVLITGLVPNWNLSVVDSHTGERLAARLKTQLPALATHLGNADARCSEGRSR